MSTTVQGYCPMGCGKTLFLGADGYVTCSWIRCPNPGAAADILDEPETQHVVDLKFNDFAIQHPLRERLGGVLFDCPLHGYLSGIDGPPRQPGRYRVSDDGKQWGEMAPRSTIDGSLPPGGCGYCERSPCQCDRDERAQAAEYGPR